MKLVYPENGLYELVKSDLEETKEKLMIASNIYFSVPDDFSERGRLLNLRGDIQSFQRKVDGLLDKASLVTSQYRELEEELKMKASILDSHLVTKRDRLIR